MESAGPDFSSGTVVYAGQTDLQDYTAESSLFITNPPSQYSKNGEMGLEEQFSRVSVGQAKRGFSDPESFSSNRAHLLDNSSFESESDSGEVHEEAEAGSIRSQHAHSSPHTASRQQMSPFESPEHSQSALSEGTNFQDLSFINDTRAQFDLDINIDEHKVEKKQPKLSPWRNMRTSPTQISLRHTSFLSRRNITQSTMADSSANGKLDELTKQLTNCKIQLKLYERFLQDLILKHHIDMGDLTVFHENLDQDAGYSSDKPGQEEMAALVEDLYASLEDYQKKWRDADQSVSEMKQTMSQRAQEMAELLDAFLLKATLDLDLPEEYLGEAIELLRSKASTAVASDVQSRLQNLLDEVEGFKSSLAQAEFEVLRQTRNAQKWQSEYEAVNAKYENLSSEFEKASFNKPNKENFQPAMNKNVEDKLQEYQGMIDRLHRELRELRNLSRQGSLSDSSEYTAYSSSRDREKHLILQHDYETMQRVHSDLANEFERYRNSSDNNISSLTNQLNNRKREIINLRADLANFENIQHDLEVAVEKQRVLTSEKIKLSYQVESLNKDKESLRTRIDSLTEKLATTSRPVDESVQKLLNRAEHLYDDLFRVDLWEFERLLVSFNKIADDESLREPKRKIEHLLSIVSQASNLLLLSPDALSQSKEYHKSVFDYFARAVDVIVNDHIRLLLKDTSADSQAEYVTSLQKRVKELESQNDSLSKSGMASPRQLLRIQELTNRWKAEREARLYEDSQAKKRLGELEQEISRLKSGRA